MGCGLSLSGRGLSKFTENDFKPQFFMLTSDFVSFNLLKLKVSFSRLRLRFMGFESSPPDFSLHLLPGSKKTKLQMIDFWILYNQGSDPTEGTEGILQNSTV